MAIVRKMSLVVLEGNAPHTEVNCTYSIVSGTDGEKFFQVDTYGSRKRKFPGKKSQSIRFSAEALRTIKAAIKSEFSD
jgi:hypothetical protein